MRAHSVEVASPAFDHGPRLGEGVEDLAVEQFVAEAGVEALHVAVLPGAAGFDVGGLRSDGADPSAHRLAMNSGPLSERTKPNEPRRMNRSVSTSMTSVGLSLRFTRIVRASLVNSPITFGTRYFLPSGVRSSTKSQDHTRIGRSALGRTHEPSFSQSRDRSGCLAGTSSPSRRRTPSFSNRWRTITCRSTRLGFIVQPSARRSAVTRRAP